MSPHKPLLVRAAETPITYGDSVEVSSWPCCGYKVGLKFRINAMEQSRSGFLKCVKCGTRHESSMDALGPHADWNPVAWLKRIEPAADIPEGTRLA